WGAMLDEQKRRFDANPQSAERPTEVERRAIEVAQRLGTYQAYSGDRFSTAGLILMMPRPSDAKYLAFTANAIKEVRQTERAEVRAPGQVSPSATSELLTASRSLGEAVNPTKYPTVAMIEQETHFNATNPFWQAPYAYGTALLLLALSLGFVTATGKVAFTGL